jgi:hypothetical protein
MRQPTWPLRVGQPVLLSATLQVDALAEGLVFHAARGNEQQGPDDGEADAV